MSKSPLFDQIVLIEDDPSHTLLIKRAISSLGSNLVHYENLNDAYEWLNSNKTELIITDLHLPDSNGVSHVGVLKGKSDSPIIVLTSSTNIEEAVEAMKQGAKDFIVKDFDKNFRQVLSLSLNRVSAASRLESERRKLQSAVQNSDDGLALVHAQGQISYSNTAFLRFVKLCAGEAANPEDLFSLLTDKVQKADQLQKRIKEGLREIQPDEVRHFEFSLFGEETKAFDLRISGLNEQHTEEGGVVVWVRDITEQKRREKFQREMLATTTHDLKGPLGAVLTGAELLGGMIEDNEKAKQLTIRIASATQGVVHLIDEFLSARRIEEGSFILRPKVIVAEALVENMRLNFETIAQSRNIDLSFEVTKDLNVHVDKLGFERVLGNLLSNAIKFTQKGGVVRVGVFQEDEDIVLSVSDDGTGMAPSEVKMVFERFSRLEKHQETNGTGIGLFVVKSIVEAHGGQIEVSSKIGVGTTFKIFFPLEPPMNERGELFCLD